MDNLEKTWYYRENEKSVGPISISEIRSKILDLSIVPQTKMWRSGMEDWISADKIPEIQTFFSDPKSHSEGELSALIEMNPKDSIDKTGTIDASSLRKALKEAKKVEKIEKKHFEKSHFFKKSRIKAVFIGIVSLAFVGVGSLFATGFLSVGKIVASVDFWKNRIFSPLPTLEDVSTEDYLELVQAVKENISSTTQVRIAQSNESAITPKFYIASNLPKGTQLEFWLKSVPKKVLSEKPIELRLPIPITSQLEKTPAIRTQDDGQLPMGEYVLIINEDDDQPKEVAQVLSKLPIVKNQAGKSQGKRVFFQKAVFLGGTPDSNYSKKLVELRNRLRTQLHDDIEGISKQLDDYQNAMLLLDKLSQISPVKAKKNKRIELSKAIQKLGLSAKASQVLKTPFLTKSADLIKKTNGEIDNFAALSVQADAILSPSLLNLWKESATTVQKSLSEYRKNLENSEYFPE